MSLRSAFPLLLLSLLLTSCGSQDTALYDKATMAENNKKFDEAITLYRQFAQEYPNHARTPEVLYRMGNLIILHEKAPLKGALVLEKIIDLDAKSEYAHKGLFIAGFTYANSLGNLEKARALYERYLALWPDSSMAASARIEMVQLGLSPDSILTAMQNKAVPQEQSKAKETPQAKK